MGLLRFLLAVSVVIAHSSPIYGFKLVGGQIAVQAFFMISGFYMALILNEKYIGENGAYKLFISNRLLRLFPVYWVVLLLTIIFSVIVYFISNGNDFGKLTYYNDYSSSLNLFSLLFLVFSNVFILFQDVVLFLGLDVTSGNFYLTSNFAKTSPALYQFLLLPQAWTIGIEISFYLIVPFLVKMKFKTIILLIILSLLLRLFIMNKGLIEDPWTYRFFPTELVFFLLGMVDYSIYRKVISYNIKPFFLWLVFSYILSFTILYNFIAFSGSMLFYFLSFFLSIPFVFLLFKENIIDRFIGELSYPIYISHLLMLTVLNYINKKIFIGNDGLTLTVLTVIFSVLLKNYVSEKIERIRQKRLLG